MEGKEWTFIRVFRVLFAAYLKPRLASPAHRAIQDAHVEGVVQDSIKPSNMLVTLHGGVPLRKAIDFGPSGARRLKGILLKGILLGKVCVRPPEFAGWLGCTRWT